MKAYIVLIRIGKQIERHTVAARDVEAAKTIAVNRFGGVVLNAFMS